MVYVINHILLTENSYMYYASTKSNMLEISMLGIIIILNPRPIKVYTGSFQFAVNMHPQVLNVTRASSSGI